MSGNAAAATAQLEAEIARQLADHEVTPVEVSGVAVRCAELSAALLGGFLGEGGPDDIMRAVRFAVLYREAREWLERRGAGSS